MFNHKLKNVPLIRAWFWEYELIFIHNNGVWGPFIC